MKKFLDLKKNSPQLSNQPAKQETNLSSSPKDQSWGNPSKSPPKDSPKNLGNSHKKHFPLWFKIIGLSLISILFLFSLSFWGYNYFYKSKFLKGTKVLGISLAGKNEKEAQDILNKKTNLSFVLKFNPKETKASLKDLGASYNTAQALNTSFSYGRHKKNLWLSFKEQVQGLFQDKEVPLNLIVDQKKLNNFFDDLSQKHNIQAQKASLSIENGQVKVVPPVYSLILEKEALKKEVFDKIQNHQGGTITPIFTKNPPPILEGDVKAAKKQAEDWLKIKLTFKKDDQVFSPSTSEMGQWVAFQEVNEDSRLKLAAVLNQDTIVNYLSGIAASINIPAQSRRVTVENDIKETVTDEGKDGSNLDVSAALSRVLSALVTYQNLDLDLKPLMVPVKPEVVVTKTYNCNFDKCIEIYLSDQILIAREKGAEAFRTYISSGITRFPTPTGTFNVYSKAESVLMEGGTGYDYYYLPNVPWVLWFYDGYSIHGTYWHSNFGTPMSHGCVNASISDAAWLYNWAPIGTPVVIHY